MATFPWRFAIATWLLAFAACASTNGGSLNPFATQKTPQQQALEVEPELEAAGFSELPATTAEQDAKLKTLPALKLGYYDDQKGAKHYWLADPDFCKCLFHGDEASYQRFENIKLENQVAERDRRAVEAQQQQQMMPAYPNASARRRFESRIYRQTNSRPWLRATTRRP